jgi:hypothetical protein
MALGEERTEDTERIDDEDTTTVLIAVLVTVTTWTLGTVDEDFRELRTTLVNFDGAAGMEGVEIEETEGEEQELPETVLIVVAVCVTVEVLWRVKAVPSTYAVAVAAGTKVVVTAGTVTVVVDVAVTLTGRGEGPKLTTKGLGGFGPASL